MLVADALDLCGHLGQCLVPFHRGQRTVPLDQRGSQPLIGRDELERELALVAQPDVVDVRVLLRAHPYHLVAARVQLEVAAHRALGADAPRRLEVARSCPEAIGVAGECATGAEINNVAVELRLQRSVVEGAEHGVIAAVEEVQLVLAGDVVHEARTAVADDAALLIQDDQRAEIVDLAEQAFLLDEPALFRPPVVAIVLERTLTARVAHRAVERMVNQQEFDDPFPILQDGFRVGPHLHAGHHRRSAAGHNLRRRCRRVGWRARSRW